MDRSPHGGCRPRFPVPPERRLQLPVRTATATTTSPTTRALCSCSSRRGPWARAFALGGFSSPSSSSCIRSAWRPSRTRERLSIAGERSRIARELHAMVAHSVAAMVVQSEAAQSLLDGGSTGPMQRWTRSSERDVRRSARCAASSARSAARPGCRPAASSQPGVDQIYPLIQRAREHGQPVELSVDGDPGMRFPQEIELGLYRILEEALQAARTDHESTVKVTFSFGQADQVRCASPHIVRGRATLALKRDARARRVVRRTAECRR